MSTRAVPFALLLLAALLAGCGSSDEATETAAADSTAVAAADTESDDAKPAKKEKAIKVDAGLVTQDDLVLPVFADGVLRTIRSVDISCKLSGQITEVRVRDGDKVRKGQVLARIDSREYSLALEESRYRHVQALSQIAAEDEEQIDNPTALNDFVEARKALDAQRSTLTAEEYQARLLNLELAALKKGAFRQDIFAQRTGLADARVAEERAQLNLEYTEIRAPFAGVVSGFTVVPGQNVSLGQTLCTVYNNDNLEAVVNVLEADLGNLDQGRPCLIAVPAVGDTLRAIIDVVSPQLDQASRTCQVIVRFQNDGRFRPGMFVRAEIAASVVPDRLLVPREAILTRDDRPLVFKVTDEGRAQWLYVDTGLMNSEWVEILAVHSGGSLAAGDKVVVSDHLTLAHEAKITLRRTREANNRWALNASE